MTFDSDRPPTAFVGSSTTIRELQKEADLAARLNIRALIAGECGVGKRRLARLIHAESSRCRGPFLRVRCGRDPEARLRERLFGGGGSASPTPGVFDRADGGVILLQDIDSLTPGLQDALIQYLAAGCPSTIAGTPLNIQVLASTRLRLIDKVVAGAFRAELYYQMNTMYLPIPPLRERPEDVEPLLEYFTSYYAQRYGIGRPRLTAEWHARCRAQDWPANVRELRTMAAALVAQTAQTLR
jgi:DNA-binding NtrC family response regulator